MKKRKVLVVLLLSGSTFSQAQNNTTDSAQLSNLNRKFIENFVRQDVTRHDSIIHQNFVCIESNGAIVGREEYMKDWARSYQTSGYTSFAYTNEVIRIFGNVALIR